jgi:hypothetical protein
MGDKIMSKANPKELNILLAIIFVSLATLIGILIYQYTRPIICKKVKRTLVCTREVTRHVPTHHYLTQCRIELEDGTRKTVNEIVAEGDEYCWRDFDDE